MVFTKLKKARRTASAALALILAVTCMSVNADRASALSTYNVKISSNAQVVDTFNGVQARYIPGTGNSDTGTYSCAGYVKSYYSTIYGVNVSNLLTGKTPVTDKAGCTFSETSSPQPGDIIYMTNSRNSGHWAICKAVSGSDIYIIEQNWKWKSGNDTYATVNRVVRYGTTSGLRAFRYSKAGGVGTSAAAANASVYYSGHVQNIGNTSETANGGTCGTTGQSLRMEALRVRVAGMSGGIQYRAHCQNYGWMSWTGNGSTAGTTGQGLRMEAVQIKLTGAIADSYNVQYRVHVQNYGWMPWVSNGATAGTTGQSLRIEAIQIKLVRK